MRIELWYCPINNVIFEMNNTLYLFSENPLDSFFGAKDPNRHFPEAILLESDFKLGTDFGDDE